MQSGLAATRIVCARSAALMPVVTPWRASMLTVNAVPSGGPPRPGAVIIGSEMNTVFAWRAFFDYGIYTNPVLPPGVPPTKSLLRTSYMATHTEALLDEAMDIIGEVMANE